MTASDNSIKTTLYISALAAIEKPGPIGSGQPGTFPKTFQRIDLFEAALDEFLTNSNQFGWPVVLDESDTITKQSLCRYFGSQLWHSRLVEILPQGDKAEAGADSGPLSGENCGDNAVSPEELFDAVVERIELAVSQASGRPLPPTPLKLILEFDALLRRIHDGALSRIFAAISSENSRSRARDDAAAGMHGESSNDPQCSTHKDSMSPISFDWTSLPTLRRTVQTANPPYMSTSIAPVAPMYATTTIDSPQIPFQNHTESSISNDHHHAPPPQSHTFVNYNENQLPPFTAKKKQSPFNNHIPGAPLTPIEYILLHTCPFQLAHITCPGPQCTAIHHLCPDFLFQNCIHPLLPHSPLHDSPSGPVGAKVHIAPTCPNVLHYTSCTGCAAGHDNPGMRQRISHGVLEEERRLAAQRAAERTTKMEMDAERGGGPSVQMGGLEWVRERPEERASGGGSAPQRGGEQPVMAPAEQPAVAPVEEPVEEDVVVLMERRVEKPVERPLEKPVERTVDRPAENDVVMLTERPVDKPMVQPGPYPITAPVENPSVRSTTNTVAKPTEKALGKRPLQSTPEPSLEEKAADEARRQWVLQGIVAAKEGVKRRKGKKKIVIKLGAEDVVD